MSQPCRAGSGGEHPHRSEMEIASTLTALGNSTFGAATLCLATAADTGSSLLVAFNGIVGCWERR